MPITALELVAKVTADTAGAEAGLKRVKDRANEASGKSGGGGGGLKGMLDSMLGIAGGIGIAKAAGDAIGFIGDQVKESIAAAQQYQLVTAQTNAVLKSTGDASGQTAASIAGLAEHLSTLTPFSQEATQSAENMLLTFRGISGKEFPEATQATLNMATAMHMDATSAALQLGKALNDPATGMGRLQREGVTFTKEQIAQAKAMEKAGNLAGAQAIILGELKKEFGGSAKAAGQTFAGSLQILQNQLEDTKIKIGNALIPVLTQLLTAIAPLMSAFADFVGKALGGLSTMLTGTIMPVMQQWEPVIGAIFTAAQQLGELFLSALQPALDSLKTAFSQVQGPGLDVHDAMRAIQRVVQDVAPYVRDLGRAFGQIVTLFVTQVIPVYTQFYQTIMTNIMPVLKDLAGFILTQVVPVFMQLVGFFVTKVMPVLMQIEEVIVSDVVPAFKQIMDAIITDVWPAVKKLIDALEKLWVKISPILIPAVQFLGNLLKNVIAPTLAHTVVPAFGFVITVITGVINVISWLIGAVGNVLGTLGRLRDFLNNDIASAWKGLGAVISGVWTGIETGIKGAINTVIGIINQMINGINSIHVNLPKVGPFGGGTIGFSIPQLPQLAAGGDVHPGGMAIVGDAGPELLAVGHGSARVTPLPAGLGGGGLAGGNQVVQVTTQINLDGVRIAQVVAQHMPQVVRNATGARSF